MSTRLPQYLASGVDFRRFIASRKVPIEGRYLQAAWDRIEDDVRKSCA